MGAKIELDCQTVIVGAPGDRQNGYESGAAFIFEEDAAGGWHLAQKIVPPDPAEDDIFGFDVAVDGDIALISAPNDDDTGVDNGSVYVFRRTGPGLWTYDRKIVGGSGGEDIVFGLSIAGDDQQAIIGAQGDDTGALNAGAVYFVTY